jgi:hypothetical protein
MMRAGGRHKGSDLPKPFTGAMGGGTYSMKQGFPVELPPSATLLRIANTVGMEFEQE